MKRIMKFILFFVFFVLTGVLYYYIPTPNYYFASRIIDDTLYLAPLWIVNIICGFIIGFCLKILSAKNKIKSTAWIFLGCILSQCSLIFTVVINYGITMSGF